MSAHKFFLILSAGAAKPSRALENVLTTYVDPCLQCSCVLKPKDCSAAAAAKQARGNSSMAAWSLDKIVMDQFAKIESMKGGNQQRALTKLLEEQGLQLACPITWIKGAL